MYTQRGLIAQEYRLQAQQAQAASLLGRGPTVAPAVNPAAPAVRAGLTPLAHMAQSLAASREGSSSDAVVPSAFVPPRIMGGPAPA
eukprot:5259615-Heterocapsa_arctica.AAC.1